MRVECTTGASPWMRQVMAAAGFEVFDPFPPTLHAHRSWFDLGGRDSLHADTLSDLVTQMIINQVCDDV